MEDKQGFFFLRHGESPIYSNNGTKPDISPMMDCLTAKFGRSGCQRNRWRSRQATIHLKG